MPELAPQSIAVPPSIDPAAWEDFPAFRETFLLYFTDPVANATLRRFGSLLHEFVLEFWRMWPSHPEGIFAAELRAAVGDMRHLQGALQEWTSPDSTLENAYEVRLAGVGVKIAATLGELADRLEKELDSAKGAAS